MNEKTYMVFWQGEVYPGRIGSCPLSQKPEVLQRFKDEGVGVRLIQKDVNGTEHYLTFKTRKGQA